MKVVKMIRSAPEVPGTPTTTEVQEQDIPALEARGWEVEGEAYEVTTDYDEKASLVAKALELDLGTEEELAAMSVETLTKLISENSDDDTGGEKASLVAKALELKAANKAAVKAAPSAIPAMSVEKLKKLISDAEAFIASGNQE